MFESATSFPSKGRTWDEMCTLSLMFLWDKKIVWEHILQSISGNGERTFFPFNLNEVNVLHLKFINVVKAIPGENAGAVFHKLFGSQRSPSKTETAGSLQNCFLDLKMPPKWKMRRRASDQVQVFVERERGRRQSSVGFYLKSKHLSSHRNILNLFGKIKNIILWNHKTENSHELMAFKDHLLWSKINSMFESSTPYTAKWLLL